MATVETGSELIGDDQVSPSEEAPVVVIGAGPAGLTAAYSS